MKRILIDTNVLISFLTDRNLEQQEKSAILLEGAARGELAVVVLQAVILELAFVFQNLYGRSKAETATLISDCLLLPGISVANDISWSVLLKVWPKDFPDLADAILAVMCRTLSCDAVATFDRAFQKALQRRGIQSYF